MKQIVQDRDDIAFYIKLLPLKIHPAAYKKAKAIICERSLRLLDRAFDGRALPDPSCETTEIDDTIELAERLGITGTPTIVLPDGGVINGYRDSVPLQQAIEAAGLAAEEKEQEELRRQQEALEREEMGLEEEAAEPSVEDHHGLSEDAGEETLELEEAPEFQQETVPAEVEQEGDAEEAPEEAAPSEPAEEEKPKKKSWWNW